MSYNVILLPAAEDDYQEILQYFERQFDSQQAIRSFVKDFGEVLLRLEETPTIYGYSRDEGLRQREYRKFLIGRYVALFKIDELRNTVEIYRIFHGTQNYAGDAGRDLQPRDPELEKGAQNVDFLRRVLQGETFCDLIGHRVNEIY